MTTTYSQPKLKGHEILYEGIKFVIFFVDEKTPFEDYVDYSNVIIFDKFLNRVVGCSLRDKKRSNSYEFNGFWVSPVNDGEEFHCNGIKELLKLIYKRTYKFG